MKPKIFIDTDAGADDLLAILLAHKVGADIDIIIANFGSFPATSAFNRIQSLLKEVNSSSRVLMGATKPLSTAFHPTSAIHGSAYVNHFFITSFISSLISPWPQITPNSIYLSLGPLTNLSKLLTKNPQQKLKKIIVMGGILSGKGNATNYSEANFYYDPHAVKHVLQSAQNIFLVPLNITDQITISHDKLDSIILTSYLKPILKPYLSYYLKTKKKSSQGKVYTGAAIHDVVATAFLLWPHIFKTKKTYLGLKHIISKKGKISTAKKPDKHTSSQITVITSINSKQFWQNINQHLFT